MDCPNCGGTMVSLGNGKLKCRFCGNRMDDPNYKAPAAPAAAPAPSAARGPAVETKSQGSFVFDKNINGVLEIECTFPTSISSGSGFLINGNYAVTNTHVVTNNSIPCNNIIVRLAGETIPASIVALGDYQGGHGSGVDLAILKLARVPAKAVTVKLANFDSVKIGESVYVIGNSLGYGTCITGGIVSDKCRKVDGHMLLMTDCAVNGGNSGGPIFNAAGDAIGAIVSGITSAEGMNFAIPSNTVRNFLSRYITVPDVR